MAEEIQSFVQKNPQFGFALILQLTGVHGSQQFDKLTRTKTVETILTSMDATGIQSYLGFLVKQINQVDEYVTVLYSALYLCFDRNTTQGRRQGH